MSPFDVRPVGIPQSGWLFAVALLLTFVPGSVTGQRPVRLSNDSTSDETIRRCLANSAGQIPRWTDTEPYAAVDPRDANRVIAVWQTGSGTGSVIQWSRSTDGGRSWSAPRAAPINACAGGPVARAVRASDPWATFGPDGRVYLSAIAWTPNPGDGPDLVSALVMVASPDGGGRWEPPVAITLAPDPTIAHDNLALTADPTRPGTVYAATTRAETPDSITYYGRLGFTRSSDGGRSWSPIRPISPAANRERIGAPQIVVDGRSGRLYAVYHRRTRGGSSVAVMSSDDGGESWSSESVAAPHIAGERPTSPVTNDRFILADDIVQAVVTPAGQLVIAYSDARRSPGQRHDISLVWSADGRNWSPPLAVSDSGTETAWLPAVTSSADGNVAVSYFAADFSKRESGTRVLLQRFRPSPSGFTRFERIELDRPSFAWPGDYQSLVTGSRGPLAVYGRDDDIYARLR